MNLKPKDTFIDRRSEQDRRSADKSLRAENLERRKRPDRRMEGLDVDVINVSEDEFLEIFSQYLSEPGSV
jgi:hypothetical protein